MNDQHGTAAPLSEMTRRYIWLLQSCTAAISSRKSSFGVG